MWTFITCLLRVLLIFSYEYSTMNRSAFCNILTYFSFRYGFFVLLIAHCECENEFIFYRFIITVFCLVLSGGVLAGGPAVPLCFHRSHYMLKEPSVIY